MLSTRLSTPLPDLFILRPEVRDALAGGVPVVALESAVISHGLPPPAGLETAAALEDEVRRGGAVPATVAVREGRILVGATPADLTRLTRPGTMKIAERDLSVAAAARATGGTTVSATIAVATACGIAVTSTGGVGGVHLGAEQTWDVSADLPALARHSALVVCAGTKAICDVPKTLEYLDTLGITVLAYGTDRFPYFYARDSGVPAPRRVDAPEEAAAVLVSRRALAQPGAVLVAQPISEDDALPRELVDEAVAEAVRRTSHLRGETLTPALLAALTEITRGRTLRANLALLRANAALASAISRALHRKRFARDGT
jgi:pseudouridine-5'-phosphate glycosidase